MLKQINKHIKGLAGNTNEHLYNFHVESSLSKHDTKGRNNKGKKMDQLKIQKLLYNEK